MKRGRNAAAHSGPVVAVKSAAGWDMKDIHSVMSRVRDGSLPVNAVEGKSSLLSCVAEACLWDCVKEMLDLGANPHLGKNHLFTALIHIIKHGQLELAVSIIEKGCSAEQLTRALRSAIVCGNVFMVSYLFSKGTPSSFPFLDCDVDQALVDGYEDVVVCLLSNGMDPNLHIRRQHCSLIQRACLLDRVVVLSELLKRGVNPDVRAAEGGLTLLHLAAKGNALHCMDFLVKSGVSVEIENHHLDTPLHTAAEHEAVEAIDFLVAHGADINRQDNVGLTPLTASLYAYDGTFRAVKRLLELGANVHIKDCNERAPIHYAVSTKCYGLIEEMLSYGAHPATLGGPFGSPLHEIESFDRGGVEISRLLIEQGCDVNVVDGSGRTPLWCLCGSEGAKTIPPETFSGVCMLLAAGTDLRSVGSYVNFFFTHAPEM